MRAFLKSVAKKTGYVVAVGIIIFAILVGTSRLLAPVLDKHLGDFENYASALLQTPVTIKNVRVSWYQYQPVIRFNDVTVLNKDTKTPILEVEKVSIFFSIPESIWHMKLVPSGMMISGTEVNLHRTKTGEISVQGFPAFLGAKGKPFQSETKMTEMLTWLSEQPRLILQNVDIFYTDYTNQKRYVTLYNLHIENSGDQHSILGKAILHQELPTEVSMTIQWIGRSVDLAQIKANIYLYVSGFSMPQWLKGLSWKGFEIKEGVASAKIWMVWDQGAFQKIQTTFQSYHVKLYSQTDKSIHKINRLSGNAGWKKIGDTQIFAGDDILIDLPSHLWPVTSFYVSLNSDASGVLQPKTIHLGYVDLNDLQTFLFSFPPLLPTATQQLLTHLNVKGAIQKAVLDFAGPLDDWKHLSLNIDFSQLDVASWNSYPGVKNLSGTIAWNGEQGSLLLHSKRMQFQYHSIFTNPIPIDQLFGDIKGQVDQNNTWTFTVSALQLLNNDGAANVDGTLSIPANGSPVADLKANLTMQKASNITRYLPMQTFDPELVNWLAHAFLAGDVPSANAILKGPLNDFPFDQGNGTFLISASINNIDLKYAPDWPKLSHITGKLVFSGRKMVVDTEHAETFNIDLPPLHAEIPYFGDAQPQILEVQTGDIHTDFAQGMKYVHASPLEKNIGKMFSGVDIKGPMILKLGLTVPLKNPDQTKVDGDIAIQDTQMNLVPWNLTVDHLNGKLHFTEDTTEANHITGELFHKPFAFSIATVKQPDHSSKIVASFDNHLKISDLETWLKIPFSKVVSGSTDVSGAIDFSLTQPIQIHLASNLKGLKINLPDQYAKPSQETRDFSADIIVEEHQPLKIKVGYDKLLSAALMLNRKGETYHLIGADLELGGGNPNWPKGAGLYISGNFDLLDWDKIKSYMGQSGNAQFASLPLRNIDIEAKVLNILGQRLTEVHLEVTPSEKNWNIDIQSAEVSGQIQAPANFSSQGLITAQFQRIDIHSASKSNFAAQSMNVKSLPSISFDARDVSYNNMPLGEVSFKTSPSSNGLVIRSLSIVSPRMNLQASGQWLQSNTTRLQGNVKSSNVSGLLTSLGLDASNLITKGGNLDFNLSWRDAPYAPSLASMTGQASLALGSGRIVNVGEASGAKMDLARMLSIFSLQTIPRRLSLDFSDLVQKGYSFDSVKGDFTLQNGSAYTSNFRIEGPVARVGINGRIGLRNKDYDFTLSVTPYGMTSSIPVAAALLTGPVGGVAALAVNTVLGSAVSKAATYYYSVKGPWDNPSWQSINTPKK